MLRAMERDDDYIKWWVENEWPEILELAEKEDATILFMDESSVQSQPNVKRTWAPKGRRPEIRAKARRDKLTIISAVKMDGELFFSVHGHDLEGSDTIVFLRKLLKEEKMEGRKFLIRERTPLALMLYTGCMSVFALTAWRRASKILEPIVERSYEAIRQWVQRFAPPYVIGSMWTGSSSI